MSGLHASHKLRESDPRRLDERLCEYCGHTDQVPGGWDKLTDPCPKAPLEGNEYLSQELVHDYYKEIIKQMDASSFVPDVIVPVMRGGSDMGVKLSHHYGVPMVPLSYQTRDGDFDNLHHVHGFLKEHKLDNKLIVDDICDSGETLREINYLFAACAPMLNGVSMKSNYRFACAITDEPHTEKLVDYYGHTINKSKDHRWFVFPWEADNLLKEV